jgi:hypothetical protein
MCELTLAPMDRGTHARFDVRAIRKNHRRQRHEIIGAWLAFA